MLGSEHLFPGSVWLPEPSGAAASENQSPDTARQILLITEYSVQLNVASVCTEEQRARSTTSGGPHLDRWILQ